MAVRDPRSVCMNRMQGVQSRGGSRIALSPSNYCRVQIESFNMANRAGKQIEMPGLPELSYIGALSEIWMALNYAAYHFAYVQVYSQAAALRIRPGQLRNEEQSVLDMAQTDLIICRTHLAAFFWHLDHVFEALRSAITRGQKEHPTERYFWSYEKQLEKIAQNPIRQEITDYRNMGHDVPAIIGCAWDNNGQFRHHFLPPIAGHSPKDESIDMLTQMQGYFEFVAAVWRSFAPGELKDRFPRSFKFPVTVPFSYSGEIPKDWSRLQQLYVSIEPKDHAEASGKVSKR